MVSLDKSVSLIVSAGSCEDVVDHYQGFTSIEARFHPGLALPVITLIFNLVDQTDIRCFRQGEDMTVILGVESGDVYLNGKVLKTRVMSVTQHYTLQVSMSIGLDFVNEFTGYFYDGTSVDALADLLGRYFDVSNDAKATSDSMSWIGYGVAKRIAMNIWYRSYYGGGNYLLTGIGPGGARIIDVLSAVNEKAWKIGSDDNDDGAFDTVSIEDRKPLLQDGLDRDVTSDSIINTVEYTLHNPDPSPVLVSELNSWRAGRRRVIEAQYSEKGPVHANWSKALAENTGYLSVLRPTVNVSFRGYLPVRIFDPVDLNLKDSHPRLELGGKYLTGSIAYLASDGRFHTILGLMREDIVL